MNDAAPEFDAFWFKARIRRHVSEALRLAWPVIIARSGVMTMALVDTVMVGRYATDELAYLGIGLVPFMPVFLILLGLLMGTVVVVSKALGRGMPADCGAAWRRSLPYAIALGLTGTAFTALGQPLLLLAGQTPEMAQHGGRIMFISGLGLPAYLLFITSSLFLEGVKNPKPGMVMMLVANLVNVAFNWVLIYGHMGFPALGAEGSAITTSLVRWLLTLAIMGYIWFMADHEIYAVRLRPEGGWRAWTEQRRVGYSAAVSIGGESVSFAILGIFAGWLGKVPLAAYSISHNLISMAFMVSLGFGSASVVRTAIARGRGDGADLRLAGWVGVGGNTVAMILIGLLFAFFPDQLAHAYSKDHAVIAVAVPLIAFCGYVVVVDGGQAVMVNALRGAGGIWAPALIQTSAFIGVMVPLAWWFAVQQGHGAIGLYWAVVAGTMTSFAMLAARFQWVSRTLSGMKSRSVPH